MSRDVPVGRRYLLSDRRRVAVGLLGVGLAVALMLLIQGLWSGTLTRITAYEDNAKAQLFVAERGTRSLQSDVSAIPSEAPEQIRQVPGVEDADPIATRGLILELHGSKLPTTLIGSEIGGLGGPWSLEAGREVAVDGEIVVDSGLAADHGYEIGDRFECSEPASRSWAWSPTPARSATRGTCSSRGPRRDDSSARRRRRASSWSAPPTPPPWPPPSSPEPVSTSSPPRRSRAATASCTTTRWDR